jgi:hypothetical protein
MQRLRVCEPGFDEPEKHLPDARSHKTDIGVRFDWVHELPDV